MLGRTPRVVPASNVGNYVKAEACLPNIKSYSVSSGLSRGPVLNNNRRVITSKHPKIPKLSPKHKLTVYISSQYIQGLPAHIEQVYRDDLTLEVLRNLVEYELSHLEAGSKLSFVVIDFVYSGSQNVGWHKAMLSQMVDRVKAHPSGNVIRFGEMWCTPHLTRPDTLTAFHKPSRNLYPLYKMLNDHIIKLMRGSGSRSPYGAIKNHVGMTGSQKNWIADAWEGYVPSVKGSLRNCSKLSPPYQVLRSNKILRILESEVRALPVV